MECGPNRNSWMCSNSSNRWNIILDRKSFLKCFHIFLLVMVTGDVRGGQLMDRMSSTGFIAASVPLFCIDLRFVLGLISLF